MRYMRVRTIVIAVVGSAAAIVSWAQNSSDEKKPPAIHSQQPHTPRAEHATKVEKAIAVLMPVGNSGCTGTIHFEQTASGLKITGEVRGLKPGKHGFHVHEFGDLSDQAKGESAGSHYNPTHEQHGDTDDTKRHAGDFGNIEANQNGVAMIQYTDPVAALNGPHSILGRAVVVHVDEDKFTQPTGDAGARAAFGVVGVAKDGVKKNNMKPMNSSN
ncbi:MAG: superoxide dismutase family protein [Phycisphaerae bacterium]